MESVNFLFLYVQYQTLPLKLQLEFSGPEAANQNL